MIPTGRRRRPKGWVGDPLPVSFFVHFFFFPVCSSSPMSASIAGVSPSVPRSFLFFHFLFFLLVSSFLLFFPLFSSFSCSLLVSSLFSSLLSSASLHVLSSHSFPIYIFYSLIFPFFLPSSLFFPSFLPSSSILFSSFLLSSSLLSSSPGFRCGMLDAGFPTSNLLTEIQRT